MSESPDPSRCPLCGEPNACGLAAGSAAPCWCVSQRFDRELLARVPAGAAGRACICRRCSDAAAPAPRERGAGG
jgi:hypothetical protein